MTFSDRVLIVDDEESLLELLAAVLEDHPCDTALSGEQALELLGSEQYALLLCDKNLPGISGLEVVEQARQFQPYCGCVIISGYASKESAIEAVRLGAHDYIEKPFSNLALLRQRLDAIIERQRLAWERDALLKEVSAFRSEIEQRDRESARRDTEIRMFNEILEARVRQATEPLRVQIEELTAAVASSRSIDEVVEKAVRETLEHVHGVADQINELLDQTVSPMMYSQLSGIARRVEDVLDLVLLAQGKEIPVTPYPRVTKDD